MARVNKNPELHSQYTHLSHVAQAEPRPLASEC